MRYWLCDPGEQPKGPYTVDEVRTELAAGRFGPRAMVCQEGATEWSPVSRLLGAVESSSAVAPSPPPSPSTRLPPAGAVTPTAEPGLGWVVPISTDPLAIVGSYLGLFGIVVPLLGPAALVLAVIALRRRSRYPGSANMSRILITMILGLLGSLVTILLVIGVVVALLGP